MEVSKKREGTIVLFPLGFKGGCLKRWTEGSVVCADTLSMCSNPVAFSSLRICPYCC